MEVRGKVLDQLTEIHAVLGGKVEHGLLAAKKVLHAHGLHIQAVLLHQAAEVEHGVLAGVGKLVGAIEVRIGGDTQDGLERGGELLGLNLEWVGRDQADLGAALGGAYGVIALEDIEVARIEPQFAGGEGKFNGYDYGHFSAFLISKSMTSMASWGVTLRATRASACATASSARMTPAVVAHAAMRSTTSETSSLTGEP